MPEIRPEQLFAEIEEEHIRPVYYLCGEENFAKNRAVEKIKEKIKPDDFNYLCVRANKQNAGEILLTASTAPVFSDRRLVIVKDAEKFPIDGKRAFADYISRPLESTVLVFLSDERRKDDALSKICGADAARVVFYAAKPGEAKFWLMKKLKAAGVEIDDETAGFIIEVAGTDLSALDKETEKMEIYFADKENKKADKELASQILGFSKEANPFELGNAVVKKDVKTAMAVLDGLIDGGEEPLSILGVISGALVKIIKVRTLLDEGYGEAELFQKAGLQKFFDKDIIKQVDKFESKNKLVSAFDALITAEEKLKTSSAVDERTLLKSLILRIAR